MKEFELSPLTDWFIKNVVDLKAKQHIKTDVQLANTINYPKGNLTTVLKGKRNIPMKYAIEFARQFQLPSPFMRVEMGLEEMETADGNVEALVIRPYNRPVIRTVDQINYLSQYETPAYISTRHRRILPEGVSIRGAEWRWFEAGGDLADPSFDENDLLLGRFIVEDDWTLQPLDELYILTTEKRLLLGRLQEVNESHFWLLIGPKKQKTKVLSKNVRELWRIKTSVLRGKN